jgi:nicotinamidase-related amidase
MQALYLDAKSTALVLIDLQAGIVSRQTAPYAASAVVEVCAELAERTRAAGGLVVYVRVDMANFLALETDDGPRTMNVPAEAMEFVPAAGKKDYDLVIVKRHWSAFLQTNLEAELRSRGVKTIVIGGVATNYGVESTARDGAGLGFNMVMVEDAMTSVAADLHQFSMTAVFPRLGRVRKTAQVQFA